MSRVRSIHVQNPLRLRTIICLILIVSVITVTAVVTADKTQTNLTIGLSPAEPSVNESFHVSGILSSSDGKPLGNKHITLESSEKSASDSESFKVLGTKDTDAEGKYDFFRPVDTPPEFLQAKFLGNDNFAPIVSKVISARGAGTDHPQVVTGKVGTVMIYSTPAGADVYIDDILRGVSPYHAGGLSEGTHNVTLSKTGYRNETQDVYISPKFDASLTITLKQ
ncbi:PEGA domain-containing protein [Methanospirillum lacunae]|uniref:PEGA domain-containing protein n=1 Tax=Methanospirillum lacunae TaxID=668570 RepID=A0A2V2N088_9EURY|nr:PEGA domain-containing protein [Methanospirillum lacunae]PWR69958.1 hypothetical protein DK846_16130 [Methanospirillum lacunae]